MSVSTQPQTSNFCSAIGVIKFDYRCAGYPDLVKITKEWAKDPNFFEICVRTVSERNFGIQFIYLAANKQSTEFTKQYLNPLFEKYGKGKDKVYAWDYEDNDSTDPSEILENIVILKSLPKPEVFSGK